MRKLSSPFDLIKKAVDIFVKKENLIFLIKIYTPIAFFSLISVAQSFLPETVRNSTSIGLVIGVGLLQILSFLTGVLVTASGIIALRKVVDGDELSFKKTYKSAWKNYWIFLLLSITLALIYLLGFVLLLIPGLLFVVWFAFSKFIMIEKSVGIKESLLRSKGLAKGNYWKILGRLMAFGGFMILAEIILSVIPYGAGSIVASLCGALFMLPTYLLYKELDAVQGT
jgi:hypothetical protein